VPFERRDASAYFDELRRDERDEAASHDGESPVVATN
jgi:hypothetical protein